MQGCSGHFILNSKDIKEVANQTIALLRAAGVKAYRRGVSDSQFKAEGVKGSSVLALISGFVPFLSTLGFFSRVKVVVKCQRSLNEGDDDLHFFIRAYPIMETQDRRESLLVSQDLGEYIGDHLHTKRCYQKIIQGLQDAALM
jgi:hypothetical protein